MLRIRLPKIAKAPHRLDPALMRHADRTENASHGRARGSCRVAGPRHGALPGPCPRRRAAGDTVQGALRRAAQHDEERPARSGQSGARFTQLEPVIRRTFDIPLMARLSVGFVLAHSDPRPSGRQVTWSFGRYISAIYADRFRTAMRDRSCR